MRNYLRNFLLVTGGIGAIAIGLILFLNSYAEHQRYTGGGFSRNTYDVRLNVATWVDLEKSNWYVAGHSRNHLYLANYDASTTILAFDKRLEKKEKLTFRIVDQKPMLLSAVRVAVDSPRIYLTEGTVPAVYSGTLNAEPLQALCKASGVAYFTDFHPATSSRFFIRGLNEHREYVLGTLEADSRRFEQNQDLLKKQIDGLFCTSGVMKVDPVLKNLIYAYSYRNEILVIDSALRLLNSFRTIDTTKRAKIKVAELPLSKSAKLSSPPATVNHNIATHGNLILVLSGMWEDKEAENEIDGTPLDIYHSLTGQYLFSFYIPHSKNEPAIDMVVFSDTEIVVLYETHLAYIILEPIMNSNSSRVNDILHVTSGMKAEHL